MIILFFSVHINAAERDAKSALSIVSTHGQNKKFRDSTVAETLNRQENVNATNGNVSTEAAKKSNITQAPKRTETMLYRYIVDLYRFTATKWIHLSH